MLISHLKKFIFIHIYKNAGSSIHTALLPYAYPEKNIFPNRILKRININAFNPTPCNSHASAIQIKKEIGDNLFESYFSFAVVRNSWDWQLSLFQYARKDKRHFQHEKISSFRKFDDYLKWRANEDMHTQSSFICDEKKNIMVSYILRYESIKEDFDFLCNKLNITTSLPHLNISKQPGYRQFYSDFGRDLVLQAFKEDIDRFKFEF